MALPRIQPVSSHTAKVIAAPTAAMTAFWLTLPFETATTRIQIWNTPLNTMKPLDFYKMFLNTEFQGVAKIPKHSLSLFNGLTAGTGYKAVQGGFRYLAQPLIKEGFHNQPTLHSFYQQTFGNYAKPLLSATAGSVVGVLEVGLLPLDTIKKVCMASKTRLSNRDIFRMLLKENVKLYRGAQWTAARNATGGFCQFGAYEFVMKFGFGVENSRDATKTQLALAAGAGGVAMTALTNPFEVLKVRAQTQKTAAELKGISYLFRGTSLKVITKSPSATLALFFAETYAHWLDTRLTHLARTSDASRFFQAVPAVDKTVTTEVPKPLYRRPRGSFID